MKCFMCLNEIEFCNALAFFLFSMNQLIAKQIKKNQIVGKFENSTNTRNGVIA